MKFTVAIIFVEIGNESGKEEEVDGERESVKC